MGLAISGIKDLGTYDYNKKVNKNEKGSFSEELNKAQAIKDNRCSGSSTSKLGVTYSSVGNTANSNQLTDEEQTLIEDKKVYDNYKLKDKGIEFGSKEWEKWKVKTGSACIPRLTEPWQVRRAWRELQEGASSEYELKKINNLKLLMFVEEGKNNCFQESRDINQHLDVINIMKNNYESFSKIDMSAPYDKYIGFLNKIEESIHKYL